MKEGRQVQRKKKEMVAGSQVQKEKVAMQPANREQQLSLVHTALRPWTCVPIV